MTWHGDTPENPTIPDNLNLATYFLDDRIADGDGERIALLCAQSDGTDRAVSYAELAETTNRVGNVLRELGVRPGQRVLIAVNDGPEFVACWYAAQKIGAVTAEVYTFLPAEDYAEYLAYTEAALAIVDGTTLAAFRRAVDARSSGRRAVPLLVLGRDAELRSNELSYTAMVSAAEPTLDAAPTRAVDVAIWKFTTGSTGSPKACVHPARSAVVSFHGYARGVLDLRPADVVLPVPKLFFGYARDLAALFPFGVGGSGVVFADRATPERLFDLIARYRPTILVNVPTMMAAMVGHPRAAEQDLSCLRLCTSAGEALPSELHRKWDSTFGVPVVDGIGSSEAYHIYLSNRPGAARQGSLGRPVPGYAVEVVDPDGRTLPDGEVGLLEITGGSTALGYYGNPAASAETFHGDTVHSSDLFRRDADGYFHYQGRADNLLKVGGIWVAPGEIENCLLAHPDVLECAVLGVTTAERAELTVPRAYLVLRPGTTLSTVEVQEFVRSRLSPHKYPREVVFLADLPKTANGKLDRRALRASTEEVR